MFCLKKEFNILFVIFLILSCVQGSSHTLNIDSKYHLVLETYNVAKELFNRGRASYNDLKIKSLDAMDTFLDLVYIMNEEMAREIRSSILKFYKIRYFYDFTNYIITLEEMIEIIDHCLVGPEEKINDIRSQFHLVIKNFEDVRHFETVYKCTNELPDEVAAAHCILHQAVLFNETMQESLISVVEIKTNQHIRRINESLYSVQSCLNYLVPDFFEQLLIVAYTDKCEYLKIVNSSAQDLINDKWRKPRITTFGTKWNPIVHMLKQRSQMKRGSKQPLLLALMTANVSSHDVVNTLVSRNYINY